MLSPQLIDDASVIMVRQLLLHIEANKARMAEQAGLSLGDYKALEYISEFEILATGELARLLNLSPSGVSALVSRLEKAGFIERDRHPMDRRVVAIRPITATCHPILSAPQHEVSAALEKMAQRNPKQTLAMYDLLQSMLTQLKSTPAPWAEPKSS
ncbi:MAG TPA: MarR family transcriptional regulator [Paenalcaligenes sp.]|nr:MarR family transcriptional regulator [Paenalcaligenes sp.]